MKAQNFKVEHNRSEIKDPLTNIEVKFYDNTEDSLLQFAVIVAKYNNKWVFCKHKERTTYECPGGRREDGEDIIQTARRELWEETGATKFNMEPICVYSVLKENAESFGMLFYADIYEFGELPAYEIEKIEFFEELPMEWTYPRIQPVLLEKIKEAKQIYLVENVIEVKDYLSKSNLPTSDFVINPYVGCPHACKYCYACFMKRFTGHSEPWGTFIDIKHCEKPISEKRIAGKSVFLSSVTDCYNKYEEKYGLTRKILAQLVSIDCELGISTKSKLILRDVDLLKLCKNLKVSMSINTLDEKFKNDMDKASSIEDRLTTLKELHNQGIYTVLFMSPMFPELTDFRAIIETSHTFIDEYWFENLNLRGSYKQTILSYIEAKYPNLRDLYQEIFVQNKKEYWIDLSLQIADYCKEKNVNYTNYFYHEELVKAKLEHTLE